MGIDGMTVAEIELQMIQEFDSQLDNKQKEYTGWFFGLVFLQVVLLSICEFMVSYTI